MKSKWHGTKRLADKVLDAIIRNDSASRSYQSKKVYKCECCFLSAHCKKAPLDGCQDFAYDTGHSVMSGKYAF
jgi:hypothetical protein